MSNIEKLKAKLAEITNLASNKMLMGGPVPRSTGQQYSGGQAFARGGLEKLTNNITGLPDLAVTAGLNAAKSFGEHAISGLIPDPLAYKGGKKREFLPEVPKVGERVLPYIPDATDIFAGAQRLGEGAAAVRNLDIGQFQPDARANQQLISETMQEQNPMAFGAGGVAGDVATLAALRGPIAAKRSAQELASAEKGREIAAAGQQALEAGQMIGARFAPTIPKAFQEITQHSTGFNTLLNRAGRVAETGLEGYVISALNKGDPLETAAVAAGGQAAGSLLLGAMGGLFGKPAAIGTNIAVSAISVGAILQLLKSATPGGKDFSLESVESGFNKVALGIAAGLFAGVSGAGRFPVKSIPTISDAFTALPRAATLSVVNDALSDSRVEKVISQLATNPDYFGPTAKRRFDRAFRNSNISINSVIDDLMKNKAFREKFEELQN